MSARTRWGGPGRAASILAILVLALVVAACGGASAPQILSSVGSSIGGGDTGGPVPAASPAAEPGGQGGLPGGVTGGDDGGNAAPLRDDLKIVYTGSLQLVVADLPAALAKGKVAVLATGGYIGASEEHNDGDSAVAVITYRIPASRWEDAIGDLRGLATEVVAEETRATEVGGQLVDLEARIRNLRASEASLVEIAKGTGKISDLLEVEAQLTQVRGQIEQLDGQRAQLADQVAYGTLVTTYGLEVVKVQETAKGWDPTEDVDGATATIIGVGQTLVSAAIWFGIVWLPVLVVLVVLALVVRAVFRRLLPALGPGGGGPIAGWGEGPGGS